MVWHPGSFNASHVYHDSPRKSKLGILSVLMAKGVPRPHSLPNQPLSAPSETLAATLTLPNDLAAGSIWIPVKLTLQNGKTQNEVAPSSTAPSSKPWRNHPEIEKESYTLNTIEQSLFMLLSEAPDSCNIDL